MNLYTSEGLAMIDTNSKVVQLHRVTELHEHCTPSKRGSLWADFKAFWLPEYVNPHGVILVGSLLVCAILVGSILTMLTLWGIEELKRIDWTQVAQLLGSKR